MVGGPLLHRLSLSLEVGEAGILSKFSLRLADRGIWPSRSRLGVDGVRSVWYGECDTCAGEGVIM